MILHKGRSYRTILDLSFYLTVDKTQLPSVNEKTNTKVQKHLTDELGRVLDRMVSLMVVAPSNIPTFLFSILDFKNGFWRLEVTEDDSWNFLCPSINKKYRNYPP